jgi:hypothetical protein
LETLVGHCDVIIGKLHEIITNTLTLAKKPIWANSSVPQNCAQK